MLKPKLLKFQPNMCKLAFRPVHSAKGTITISEVSRDTIPSDDQELSCKGKKTPEKRVNRFSFLSYYREYKLLSIINLLASKRFEKQRSYPL